MAMWVYTYTFLLYCYYFTSTTLLVLVVVRLLYTKESEGEEIRGTVLAEERVSCNIVPLLGNERKKRGIPHKFTYLLTNLGAVNTTLC